MQYVLCAVFSFNTSTLSSLAAAITQFHTEKGNKELPQHILRAATVKSSKMEGVLQ